MSRPRYLFDTMHPLMQLLFLGALSIVSAGLFAALGFALVRPLFGITNLEDVIRAFTTQPDEVAKNPGELNALKLLQLLASIGAFLLPALFFAQRKFPVGDYLKLKIVPRFSLLLLAIAILFLSTPLVQFTYELNQKLSLPAFMGDLEKEIRSSEDASEKLMLLFLKMPGPIDLLFNLLVIAVIPAIGEELMFRGCIQQVINEWINKEHAAVWISAAIFSFIHFEFYGFIPRLLLGALLGYLFLWSGNLWTPIAAHALNNGVQVILIYLHDHGMIAFDINSNDPIPIIIVLICTVLTAAGVYMYQRKCELHKFIY